ncbi:MAG TPA: murein L,D-transpeptidase catalytic domain family protein [Caulobacteraceae bacterium]|jgi:hypothetical protein|nr:murein L,D-transpeptidase catalytic domain family protein [Caulobacteraceae bacterium]
MLQTISASRRRFLQVGATVGLAALAVPKLALAAQTTPLAAAKAGLARVGDRIAHHDVVGVADFSLPSSDGRLYLVDMATGASTSMLVAHGRGSDPTHTGWLTRFSNEPNSQCTSEGAFRTLNYYDGEHGASMRLAGLDASNSNAESRAIVVHSAAYVSADMLRTFGVLGRSEGCFALSQADLPTVLERLGPGRLLISTRL